MSDRPDSRAHDDRWDDDLAAYALDALDRGEREQFEVHLRDCESCRERLRWLQPAVDCLPAAVPQERPPATLRARLMEVVEAEAADAKSKPAKERRSRGGGGLFGITLRPALAGLAVVLLLAAGVAGYAIHDSGPEPAPETFAAEGAGRDANASGTLAVSGDSGSLHVTGLQPTGSGKVYQAWIQDRGSQGAVHASSVFVVSTGGVGDVSIPHGLADARRVMVTREPKGGSEVPSGGAVLTADMG